MASITGTSGVIKVCLTGGSAAAMAEIRSYSLDKSADSIESSVMGDTARTYLAGLSNSTMSVECYFDSADTTGQAVLDERAVIDFEIHPAGTGTGTPKYSGSGIVTSSNIAGAFDGMVDASFTVQVSGAVTVGTNP